MRGRTHRIRRRAVSIPITIDSAVNMLGAASVGHLPPSTIRVGHDMHGSLAVKVNQRIRVCSDANRMSTRTSPQLGRLDGIQLLPVGPAAAGWLDTVLIAAGMVQLEQPAEEHLG